MQGRSPYDEVVQGDGEEDPRAPKQLYDEKGRPVNPETKRLNREIVRSHNEVMHVIGVAEPDPSSNEAEILAARRYLLYEQEIGDRMGRLGDALMEVGVWGCWGLRRRVMVRSRGIDAACSVLTRGLWLGLQVLLVQTILATDADLPRRDTTAPYRAPACRPSYTSGLEGTGLHQAYLPWQVHSP